MAWAGPRAQHDGMVGPVGGTSVDHESLPGSSWRGLHKVGCRTAYPWPRAGSVRQVCGLEEPLEWWVWEQSGGTTSQRTWGMSRAWPSGRIDRRGSPKGAICSVSPPAPH